MPSPQVSAGTRLLLSPFLKPLVFVAALLPFASLFYGALADTLGPNPAEYLIRSTGEWALRFLCITLAVTPLRVIFKQPALLRLRRMFGLYTFFYAVLHLLCYAVFDMGLDVVEIASDIAKRPFILVGFTAFVLLLPLAATSFNGAIRALGGRRWQKLHRLVYAVAPLAILHFFWMREGKQDFAEVMLYGVILATLLTWRAWAWKTKRASTQPTAARRAG